MTSAEYHKQWRKKNPERCAAIQRRAYKKLAEIMCEVKINGCAICGYNKCNRALSFHHVNPDDKKFLIITNNLKRPNILEEIQKCILLCANCHMEIHDKEEKNV